MKKFASFLLLFVLIFGFAGCENKTPEKKKQSEPTTTVTATVKTVSEKTEVQPAKKEEPMQAKKSEEKYIGNKNTHKFHRTSCGTLPKEKNRVYLNSRKEAIDKYYKACKKCNP